MGQHLVLFRQKVFQLVETLRRTVHIRWVARAIAAVSLVCFGIVLLQFIQDFPVWQVGDALGRSAAQAHATGIPAPDLPSLENEYRKTTLQLIGGAFALVALYLTFRRVKVAEQGHITDRYTKAIEQLGAITSEREPNIPVRLGAVYALERIAFDSSRDHGPIMEVLTAYIRQNSIYHVPDYECQDSIEVEPLSTEIQAIITVLGRRKLDRHDAWLLDLNGTNLRSISFEMARLQRANFLWAFLKNARFQLADLRYTCFKAAVAEGALFYRAKLQQADFICANLRHASFSEAILDEAKFMGADIYQADFRNVRNLQVEQFENAQNWEQAKFDGEFYQRLKKKLGNEVESR